ncbi:MAG: molybdopterin molybdotransferase MoeA [Acidobacteriaceae bacterium]
MNRAPATISFASAASIVAAHAADILSRRGTEAEACDLLHATGRVLASPISADRDQPPFARVTRDGFAVRALDLIGRVPLQVIGQLRAGESWPSTRPPVGKGQAVEIMTGAPLPPGTDAVLMVEHAQQLSDAPNHAQNAVRILPQAGHTLAAGDNVVPCGSEARKGQVLVPPGTRLHPEEVALAASCGLRSLQVYPRVQVAILATGDELMEPTEPAASILPHRIYDSNSHAIAALVQQNHAIPVRRRAARDEREDLAACIRQGFTAAPLLLLTGGVSMGKYDLVEEVLSGMGAEFFFTGVTMRPGKPVVFGRLSATLERPARYFFGLPGNPVSAMVTFRNFVEPLLAAMSGEQNWQPRIAMAQLTSSVQAKPGLTQFLPARLDSTGSSPTVTPIKTQGSGDLTANARANCYLIVPEDCEARSERQTLRVLLR